MKVEKVSATIRYSQDTGKGSWKVVELGAEASVSDHSRSFTTNSPTSYASYGITLMEQL